MRHWNHRLKIYGRIRGEGYLQKLFACSTMTSNKQTKEGNRQMAESILVVDDEQEIADLVEVYLQNEGYTVHKFYNAKDALNCLDKTTISLALLDVMLPDMDGFLLCRQIRQKFYFPIIMLTAKVEDMDKIMGLTVGADDYITKPFGMMEFIARVKAVLRRSSRHGDDRELRCEELSIFPGRHQVYSNDQPVELTRKEFELLLYLMENRGIVMTRDQILCHIWGYDFDGETRTVDVHVRTLRQKLGDTGRLIETVRGVGYRMADKGGNQG